MIDPDRALRAFTDVLAVEYDEDTEMARVVTMSDCYDVDMRETRHLCPDREYNDVAICKHLVASEVVRGQLDVPGGWLVVDDLYERTEDSFPVSTRLPDFEDYTMDDKVMTDGGQVEPERSGNTPEGHDQFTVADMANENANFFDSKPKADDGMDKAKDAPGVEPELFPPGESPEFLYHGDDADDESEDSGDDYPTEPCAICGDAVSIGDAQAGPDGQPIHGDCGGEDDLDVDVIEHSPNPAPEPDAAHEPEALSPEEIRNHAADLDERDVGTDPLKWMPGEFVDEIDGSQAINRKGFEVLRFFYDVSLDMQMEVDPVDNDMTHCRFKAIAERDGDTVEAWGTSHVDRGDEPHLLIEMAATRARKRAISIATGAGAIAVAELQNEVQ